MEFMVISTQRMKATQNPSSSLLMIPAKSSAQGVFVLGSCWCHYRLLKPDTKLVGTDLSQPGYFPLFMLCLFL